mmetsp:Transcript_7426/g.10538  ORF Transcript_7426/g.10538 Transcript_7426/m.10538 type:complete len:100 (+) Transcript_7426:302-601(+)|eukprot:CAMPEP_0185599338 /NCGR_PEP_ID=MMETSP0434-20130131/82627_1 /TAXON_ID=626734 ORGANISM="Favella taraikaensis, Strain Fe Narragansett Bay" /NCGR_SAMPLE_ID=MMETSP0434 /ASSEMBLY_ACC=CAM_ASM_000379 /LENGTH=99 /DNA_ID=CAMNT_0028228683 /DNA_START=1364 /DNA_END=1663 /DNA_ORIENTATION=+
MDAIRQEVLSSQLDAPWEVIHLLELAHTLEKVVFQRLGGPHDQPVVLHGAYLVWENLIFLSLQMLAKAVVFKHVFDQFDLDIRIELVEEALIDGWLGPV